MRIRVKLEVATGEPGNQELASALDLVFEADRVILKNLTRTLAGTFLSWAYYYLEHIPGVVALYIVNYSNGEVTCHT